jgi:hypothetical protein
VLVNWIVRGRQAMAISKKIKDEEGEKKIVHNLWSTVGQG